MEVVSLIVAAVTPMLIVAVTNVVKTMKQIKMSDYRVTLVRAVVAVLAVIVSALTFILGDGEFDNALVETAILAVVQAAAATWLYLNKK